MPGIVTVRIAVGTLVVALVVVVVHIFFVTTLSNNAPAFDLLQRSKAYLKAKLRVRRA